MIKGIQIKRAELTVVMRKPSKVFPHQDIWLCAAFNHIWMNSFYRGRFSNLEKVKISKD